MSWIVYADSFSSDNFNNFNLLQPVIFSENTVLNYARAWVVMYNAPSFTNLSMKIFSYNLSSLKGGLLYTSTNAWTLPQITTEDNAIKEIYFEFNKIPLSKDNTYYFSIGGTGATFTSSSHVAWKKAYPDPIYTTNVNTTYTSMGTNPYEIYFVGSKL